jgi:hypothetical protein
VGTTVGVTALAVEPQTGDTVRYALTTNPGNLFAIDAVTGVVTVNGALDFETAAQYSITVQATSSDGSTSSSNFAINVNDVGEIYVLTAGVDSGTAFTGGANDDTFEGTDTTLTIFDSLNGGAGTDSLNLTFADAVTAIAAGVDVAAIENISVQAAGTVDIDISDWTGVETVMIQGAGADNDVTVVSAASVSVTVSGDNDISITDATVLAITAVASGDYDDAVTVNAAKATSVTLIDVNEDSSVTAPKLTTLTLTDIADGNQVKVTLEDLTSTALTVNLSAGDNDVILVDNDGEVETLTITVSSAADVVAMFAGATAVALNGTGAVELFDNDGTTDSLDSLETITVSGAVALTIDVTDMDDFASLTSTSTGDLDVTIDNDVAISTGAGDDIVTLTAALDNDATISLGAGDDRLEIGSNSIAFGAIDGGAGDLDVIVTDNDNLSIDYSAAIHGFEVLAVRDLVTDSRTVDVDKFDGIQRVELEAGYDNDVTIDNLDSGAFVTLGAANNTDADNDNLIIVLDNDDGAADAITITLESTGAAAYDYGTMVITGIESVTLNVVATGLDGADNDVTVFGQTQFTINGTQRLAEDVRFATRLPSDAMVVNANDFSSESDIILASGGSV